MHSKGVRPPCGLWRVTLERPKVTKGLLPWQTARDAVTLGSLSGSDVAPHTAHPCAACGCAVIPDGATDSLNPPRRLSEGRYAALKMVCVPTSPFWGKHLHQLKLFWFFQINIFGIFQTMHKSDELPSYFLRKLLNHFSSDILAFSYHMASNSIF